MRRLSALRVGLGVRRRLADTIRWMGREVPSGVRWVDSEGIHLTLKFLGDIDPALVEDVLRAMEQAASGTLPFQVHLNGLGVFPNLRRPRVLWAGVGGDMDALGALQEKVEAAMEGLAFPRERRAFSPHLTL